MIWRRAYDSFFSWIHKKEVFGTSKAPFGSAEIKTWDHKEIEELKRKAPVKQRNDEQMKRQRKPCERVFGLMEKKHRKSSSCVLKHAIPRNILLTSKKKKYFIWL